MATTRRCECGEIIGWLVQEYSMGSWRTIGVHATRVWADCHAAETEALRARRGYGRDCVRVVHGSCGRDVEERPGLYQSVALQ